MTLDNKTTIANQQKPKNWQDVIDMDFPNITITDATINLSQNYHPRLQIRGDVRLATGRFYTDEEFEERRRKAYATPLP